VDWVRRAALLNYLDQLCDEIRYVEIGGSLGVSKGKEKIAATGRYMTEHIWFPVTNSSKTVDLCQEAYSLSDSSKRRLPAG
jgi:hypothetical protein